MIIDAFRGEYNFLSNFWYVDVYGYPTVEHYFQAMKTTDPVERDRIKALRSPAEAKRAGRRVALRPDWESIKLDVMEAGLRYKFAPGKELANKLIATGDAELVEGNTWNDTFWGVCRGRGENHLGKLLMKVRGELQ